MSELAQKAVLMPSISVTGSTKQNGHSNKSKHICEEEYDSRLMVHGPMTNQNSKGSISSVEELMQSYKFIGFQATQYGRAVDIANSMIVKQPQSKQYVINDGCFVEMDDENNAAIDENGKDNNNNKSATLKSKMEKLVYPSIFLGITANLVGTGCREAVRFLVKYGVRPRCTRCLTDQRKDKYSTSCNRCECQYEEICKETNVTEVKSTFSEELSKNNSIDNDVDSDSDELNEENDAVLPIEPLWFTSHTSRHSEVHNVNENIKSKDSRLQNVSTEKETIELPYKSFIDVLVVSGGAVEHDLRRACQPYYLSEYTNDECNLTSKSKKGDGDKWTSHNKNWTHFGNITYEQTQLYKSNESAPCELFDILMILITKRLKKRQDNIRRNALASVGSKQGEPFVCKWTITPSQIWKLVGLWLVELISYALTILARYEKQLGHHDNNTEEKTDNSSCNHQNMTHTMKSTDAPETCIKNTNRWMELCDLCDEYEDCCSEEKNFEESYQKKKCERESDVLQYVNEARQRAITTVVYWAALQEVPIFSPSFVDGDIMHYLHNIDNYYNNSHCTCKEKCNCHGHRRGESKSIKLPFQIDLVQDIHALNKFAMRRRHTGMLICGGGVIKHHICNANLMRNGADKAIFFNNGGEFDGSDAGARPEEALSWGKIRIDGSYVKVYGEATTTLPLLIAQVFVPAARNALQRHYSHQHIMQEHEQIEKQETEENEKKK